MAVEPPKIHVAAPIRTLMKTADRRSTAQFKNDYLRDLRKVLIPWAQREGIGKIALGIPPVQAPDGMIVTVALPSEHNRERTEIEGIALASDDASRMISMRLPRIAFVLEGAADFVVGARETARRSRTARSGFGPLQIASLTAGQALLLPSGILQVPAGDPVPLHWFQPSSEKANNRIFWLIFLPDGVLIHTCETKNERHAQSPDLFVKEPRLLTLNEMLAIELSVRAKRQAKAKGILIEVLTCVERALANERLYLLPEPRISLSVGDTAFAQSPPSDTAFGRASAFIASHLHEDLTPELIARQISFSPRQLYRIFHTETGMTVMRYITSHRVATAQILLRETPLRVNEIGKIVGIANPVVFCHIFARATGCSPAIFRKQISTDPDCPR